MNLKQHAHRLFRHCPSQIRWIPASLHGYRLRHWRYGPESEKLVAEYLEREQWLESQWTEWREERLAFILQRARQRVPFYREYWDRRRQRGDRQSWRSLENWPILEKETLRKHGSALVADDCDTRSLYHQHTSGTTGKALDLWCSRDTLRAWYALYEARCRRWHDVSRHDRWAILGGQLVTNMQRRRPPFWVWNAGLKQLYCSVYHLASDLAPSYLQALADYRIRFLTGYTSALDALAQAALRHGCPANLQLKVILTNAEPVSAVQRQTIESAFGCPVRETYGMAEYVAAASECEHGRLHWWPSSGIVEIDDSAYGSPQQRQGELIATGLMNVDMPLIRYRVGDRVSLGDLSSRCTCGRSLPLLTAIEGRTDDVLWTQDGRPIGRLDPVFKANLSICEAQIIQESIDEVCVLYVPGPDFYSGTLDELRQRLQDRLGPMQYSFRRVEQIPRTANGKFRAVICKIQKPTNQGATADLQSAAAATTG